MMKWIGLAVWIIGTVILLLWLVGKASNDMIEGAGDDI